MWIWREWLRAHDAFVHFPKAGHSYFCFYLFGKNSCLFWQEVWELICAELTALIACVLEDHLGEIKVFEKTSLLHLVFILSLQVQVPKKKDKGNRCWIRVLNKVA